LAGFRLGLTVINAVSGPLTVGVPASAVSFNRSQWRILLIWQSPLWCQWKNTFRPSMSPTATTSMVK
jgi:hypothetical protein